MPTGTAIPPTSDQRAANRARDAVGRDHGLHGPIPMAAVEMYVPIGVCGYKTLTGLSNSRYGARPLSGMLKTRAEVRYPARWPPDQAAARQERCLLLVLPSVDSAAGFQPANAWQSWVGRRTFGRGLPSGLGRRGFRGDDLGDFAGHCDLVPAPEAATTACLDDVIDPDTLFFEQELRFRSRVDHSSQLQELAQTDGVVPDGHSAHGGDPIGFGATPERTRECRSAPVRGRGDPGCGERVLIATTGIWMAEDVVGDGPDRAIGLPPSHRRMTRITASPQGGAPSGSEGV